MKALTRRPAAIDVEDRIEGDLYLYAEHGPVFSTREPHDDLRAAGILIPAVVMGLAALAVAAMVFFLR